MNYKVWLYTEDFAKKKIVYFSLSKLYIPPAKKFSMLRICFPLTFDKIYSSHLHQHCGLKRHFPTLFFSHQIHGISLQSLNITSKLFLYLHFYSHNSNTIAISSLNYGDKNLFVISTPNPAMVHYPQN